MKNKDLRTLIPILGSMLFFIQGDSYATSPLLIEMAADFGIGISGAGLTAVSYMLPFGLFTVVFGPLGDRYGKSRLITVAAFGTAVFSILGGLAPSLATLCVLRAINGAFAAAVMPVSMALIGEAAGEAPGRLHVALGRTMALMFFGGAVGPVLGSTLAYFGSWRLVYILYGAFELLIAVLIVTKVRFRTVTDTSLTLGRAYGDALANGTLMKTVGIMSLLGMAVLGGFTYMGKYVQASTGITVFQVGLVLAFYGLGTLAGGRLGPWLTNRAGSRYFVVAAVIGAAALASIALLPSIYVLPAALFGFGLTFTLIQPMLVARAQAAMPGKRGTVMSLASFNMSVGGGLGTLLFGWVLGHFGLAAIYLIAAVEIAIVAAYATGLGRREPVPA